MLEFDAASKRFGALRRARRLLVHGPARPAHRLPRARTVPGRRPRCGPCSGWSSWTAARCAGAARRSTARSAARFGYMPEERGLYPRMRVRDQLVYLGRLCGRHQRRRRAGASTGGSSGSGSRTAAATASTPVARQPAACPADRRPGQRARPARARRAVLRPRPARHRQHVRAARRGRGARARRCCSPATSSTWSRTSARTSSSSTTAGSSSPASWPSCAPRCRSGSSTSATAGAAPDWSALPSVRGRRGSGRPGPAAGRPGTSTSPP